MGHQEAAACAALPQQRQNAPAALPACEAAQKLAAPAEPPPGIPLETCFAPPAKKAGTADSPEELQNLQSPPEPAWADKRAPAEAAAGAAALASDRAQARALRGQALQAADTQHWEPPLSTPAGPAGHAESQGPPTPTASAWHPAAPAAPLLLPMLGHPEIASRSRETFPEGSRAVVAAAAGCAGLPGTCAGFAGQFPRVWAGG